MTPLPISDSPRWRAVAAVRLALFLVVGAAVGFAASSTTRTFDLPADTADKSLKRFSEQAGLEVIFATQVGREVRTRAVKGEMPARQALDAMLADTGLVVIQDKETGAITVSRAASPNAPGAAPTAKSVRPEPIAEANSNDTIQLSPFVVATSQDTGYQATTTLAGTRLNTPVKDLGASISIYTKDFIDDIGATNSSELLIFATGMEAAGAGGNFSGATNDINAAQVIGDGPRINPQSSSRTRGLAAPNFTRGFYTTDIASDSYNVESVTVNRGPNAILFGVGSPAGVVESSLLRPNLSRNINKVGIRAGDNSSLRNTVDFNRVLIRDKLALRIAALNDEERYNQRPAFEKQERIYGALTFEPYRSTALRLNFESGGSQANRPITVLPFNSISSYWETAGRPGYDWRFYDDPARNPNALAQVAGPATEGPLVGQNGIFGNVTLVYGSASAAVPDFGFTSVTRTTTGTAANSVRAGTFNPLVNRDTGNDSIRFLLTRNIFELPGTFWTAANVLPGQLPGFAPAGIKQQGFTNYDAFDFQNRMIDETSRQSTSFHAFNMAFEQRAWEDRIGLELAYDFQRADRHSKNSFFSSNNGNHVRIDTNVTLPNGQPNPNVGRPYVFFGQSAWTNNLSERGTKRATGYIKYDFKDLKSSWSKWLGRHTVTGLYEENAAETVAYGVRLAADGAAARDISADINAFLRRPVVLAYLGPSIIGNTNPLRLEPIRIPEINAGPLAVPVSYFVRAANATDPGAFVDAPASFVEITNSGTAERDVIKSTAFLLQSYWLQNHLITLAGWRRDEDFFVRENIRFVRNPADSNDPGKVRYGFNDFSFPHTPPPNVAGETRTYSGVLRWPQKLIKLPAGTDLSVFYNQSANFTPSGGRVNLFGEPLASPQGKTKEYGFSVSAFHNKLNLRVNRFETSVEGQSFTPSVYNLAANNAVLQIADLWGVEGNVNPHLVAMRNADIELLFSPLPANFRQLHGWQISGTAPNLVAAGRIPLAGAGDTTDYVAKGTEFEIVYNPTRNWRILANIAKQETVQTNSIPFLKGFIARMTPVWDQLRDRARTTYPIGWQPGDSLGGVQTLGDWLDATILVPFATAIATEGSASAEQRKWRANLVTNYTFGRDSIFDGRLKGWSIGGAVRWQDKLGIGYPTTRKPDGGVTLDLARPFYAPADTNIDAFIGYERALWSKRIKWKVQLNARNIIADTSTIPIGVQPNGEFSTVRLPPEKRWYLTNTFSF